MSKQLIAVRSEDLVVGKEYYDTSSVCSESTLLRFFGRDEYGHLLFDRASGPGVYHRDRSGKIPFGVCGCFYEHREECVSTEGRDLEVKIIRPDADIDKMSEEDILSSIGNALSLLKSFKRMHEDESESEENKRYASGYVSGFNMRDRMHALTCRLDEITRSKSKEG